MNDLIKTYIAWCLCIMAFVGCTRNVAHDNLIAPTSTTNGTSKIFNCSDAIATEVITNRFSDFKYRGMKLDAAIDRAYFVKDWHPTNGFVLFPFMNITEAITNIPTDKGSDLPYIAVFYIVNTPVESNQTEISVRTVVAQVIDGQQSGIHGGMANHYRDVPPIRDEEENVLNAISAELMQTNW